MPIRLSLSYTALGRLAAADEFLATHGATERAVVAYLDAARALLWVGLPNCARIAGERAYRCQQLL